MSFYLGVDTGGTYTDAVVLDAASDTVIGKAKALTTRHDLSVGIGGAVDAALLAAAIAPGQVSLVSLSTTLATNALVEGQGGRVALIAIGFDADDLGRAGLAEALKGDPVIRIAGGHSHSGSETAPLDIPALTTALGDLGGDVMGFAVAARFATRNPAHEVAARAAIRAATGRPVTCSHELSAQLNGPKRALTAVLNARLTPSGPDWDRRTPDGGARRWRADFCRRGARAAYRDDPERSCRQHRWRALADRREGRDGQ
jgi:N-methylhydantoinase A/oxoprolinase/acetone carboxylase beta subunit